MKTFKQYITEYSSFDPGVEERMYNLGYKFLGKGVDQMTFKKPAETFVVKIFGTNSRGYSQDHKMFIDWFDYCKKNPSNKFLPKIHDWKPFDWTDDFGDSRYLQIKMEMLKPVPREWVNALTALAAFVENNYRNDKELKNMINKVKSLDRDGPMHDQYAKLMLILDGEKDFDLLVSTLKELFKIGAKKGWDWDLHPGNFMLRGDSTPVIVDPWVV